MVDLLLSLGYKYIFSFLKKQSFWVYGINVNVLFKKHPPYLCIGNMES